MGSAMLAKELDMMLCGGSDAAIIPIGLGGFVTCKALSQQNTDPARDSWPWDSVMLGTMVVVSLFVKHSLLQDFRDRLLQSCFGRSTKSSLIVGSSPLPIRSKNSLKDGSVLALIFLVNLILSMRCHKYDFTKLAFTISALVDFGITGST
ncbi:3-oxoacyl-[acyl-carrier-protein] synthase I, chloroplastic [Capsicum baccatum]|uniref:beta-ketoacyl-[acyl-carrier-protein] synthase I n=1 Tax=Capsicum baccatum TaxID=33114 RepID=A0A2G2VYK1_CAPBA|nr:3-oxoacyl-[acyl-carrier-protein] synthase I, chloroplastic [Capsicum baccatum]